MPKPKSAGAPTPRLAAAALVITKDGRVLAGERSPQISFLGSFIAFPGGRSEPGDAELAGRLLGGTDDLAIAQVAALRELFEEVGILVAGGRAILAPEALASGPVADAYAALELRPDASELVFAGRWVTPESAMYRFDTRFFLVVVDEASDLRPSKREFTWARFVRPDDLLAAWRRFEVLISPPTKFALEVLALGHQDAPRRLCAIPEASGGESAEFEPIPGIRAVPVRTPTLPPARHTNAYIIGDERLIIVDPATYEADERDKLLERVRVRTRAGATVEAIVLTHHHVDHIGAASWLGEQLGAPIAAHPITRRLLAGKVAISRTLEEGDVIDLGRCAATDGPFRLEVLFTPGHAPGHIVLVDRRPGAHAMIVGDMIAGIGTIIIDPPEGDMAEYLRQLERLRAMPKSVLFPSHGHPAVDSHGKLGDYIAHRLMREEKIERALRGRGVAGAVDLLDEAYADTPAALYPLAARSCLAHLEKLVADGRAARAGDRFRAV